MTRKNASLAVVLAIAGLTHSAQADIIGGGGGAGQTLNLTAEELQLVDAMMDNFPAVGQLFSEPSAGTFQILSAGLSYDASNGTATYGVFVSEQCPFGAINCGPQQLVMTTPAQVPPQNRANRAMTVDEQNIVLALGHEAHTLDDAVQLNARATSGTVTTFPSTLISRGSLNWNIILSAEHCVSAPIHFCREVNVGALSVTRTSGPSPTYSSTLTRY